MYNLGNMYASRPRRGEGRDRGRTLGLSAIENGRWTLDQRDDPPTPQHGAPVSARSCSGACAMSGRTPARATVTSAPPPRGAITGLGCSQENSLKGCRRTLSAWMSVMGQ